MTTPAEINEALKDVGDGINNKVLPKLGALQARLDELEQKGIRAGGTQGSAQPSIGDQFIQAKADDFARVAQDRGRTSLSVKAAITSATTAADGSAGDLVVPSRDSNILLPRRRLTVRDLLTVVQVDSGSVEYAKQVGRTNNAAPVAEGAAKPESSVEFDLVTTPVRTIAHFMKASKQVLDDAPQLRSIIDEELMYGLNIQEETQLLSGDNTGQNLNGMIPQATAYAAPFEADGTETMIDTIGLAINQCSLTEYPPDGVILHPSDWMKIRMLKDGEGNYLFGPPGAIVQPIILGLPVVATQAMTIDKFLVGSFKSQVLYDRWEARVELGFVNDDFTKNLVTLLGEERIGFAAKAPSALIYGDFGNVG